MGEDEAGGLVVEVAGEAEVGLEVPAEFGAVAPGVVVVSGP